MRFCIDIDGTICLTPGTEYGDATPIPKAVELINSLKNAGHYIIIFTARGTQTGTDWRDITEEQMERWKVPYDELIFGKPAADIYIDDKALAAETWRQLP